MQICQEPCKTIIYVTDFQNNTICRPFERLVGNADGADPIADHGMLRRYHSKPHS